MFFSAEPFLLNVSENLNDNFYYPDYYTIQDQVVRPSERPGAFKWLNDRPLDPAKNRKSRNKRVQLYLHHEVF